ncbi:glycosyl hydrolase family 95 catalytic domain-containing protein [Bacillus sp. S3]|uniref:glycoside hydrolase family 95 protein n=1 Tax=Bacillus sp. S3 TaxID=486398 RepID=UPI0016807482|nr:glycoside hydrolase family 95 protein [Bacillus sp. S3]
MKKLFYNKPASDWNEALPIGNGFLGAMIFGQVNKERIQLNEDSLWSGGFMDRTNPDSLTYVNEVRELLFKGQIREAEKLASQSMFAKHPHMRHYQTMGDVWIEFFNNSYLEEAVTDESGLLRFVKHEVEIENYQRELNLEEATIDVSYQSNGNHYERKAFASYPNQVVVYHLKSKQNKKLNFEISMTRKDLRSGRGASYLDELEAFDHQFIRMHGHQGSTKNGLDFCTVLKVETSDGTIKQMGSHIVVENASEACIYITGRTSYRNSDPYVWCMETLDNASSKGYKKLLAEHVEDYQHDFNKVLLQFERDYTLDHIPTNERLDRLKKGEKDLGLIELYADFGRYLLISSSKKGSLPANLQGIWNQDFEPAWGSKYTININIQMNYWMAERTGLSDYHLPLFEHLKKISEKGSKVAREMYGARGFVCHHNTDIWGDAAPQDSHIPATIWPMGGAWLCLHVWEHYQYTKDQDFLNEYYPIVRDSVLFFVDYLVKDMNGEWVTGPSVSPENIYMNRNGRTGTLCMGPSMDTQIVRELFQDYLMIVKELNIQDDEIESQVKEKLLGLPEIKIGKHGQIQEWSEDYDEIEPGHRHISQLFALYPGNQINVRNTPDLAEASKLTLKRRLENGGGHTGWSKAWILNFWARLEEPEEAWKNLNELLMNSTLDNLFDNHPPFQIDGNFGGSTGIFELLMQNYNGTIYILPALPEEMSTGSVQGLRTKEGAVIDIFWENMKIKKVEIFGFQEGNINICIPARVTLDHKEITKNIAINKDQRQTLEFYF